MKKLVLLCVAIAGFASHAYCYDFYNKELALIEFNVKTSSEVKSLINKADPSFLSDSNSYSKFLFVSYFSIEKSLKARGINVLPMQCFGEKAGNDSFGFPSLSARRAVKTGVAKFYYKLDIDISIALPIEENKTKLLVKMTITPYKSPSIIPMEKVNIEQDCEVVADENLLQGYTQKCNSPLDNTLLSAINKAADKLTKVMVK